MFQFCSSLTSVDLSNFDTSEMTDMMMMFYNCSSIVSINLSSFDTSNVTNMDYMFQNCTSLKFVDISNFNITEEALNDRSYIYDQSPIFDIFLNDYNIENIYITQ